MKRTSNDRFIFLRNGVFTFKKRVPGRASPLQVSLETADRTLAREKRDGILKQIADEELEKIRGPRSKRATVAELLAAYRGGVATVTTIEPSTVRKCANDVLNFLDHAGVTTGEATLVTTLMESATVRAFKTNYLAAAAGDREAMEARRRGAEALLRNVRAVFSRAALPLYKALHLPVTADFLREARVECALRQHELIAPGILRAMDAAMSPFRETDVALWLVHVLEKFGGLRAQEVWEARAEWFLRAPWGQVFLDCKTRPYFEFKGTQGPVPLHSEVVALLSPLLCDRAPLDHIVPAASATERRNLVERTHSDWLRQFLPAEQFAKCGHELRRHAARIMELKHGLQASEDFLRHARKSTAEKHYLEKWNRWRRLGSDLGITLAEARGESNVEVLGTWTTGAAAFQAESARPALKAG